MKRPTIALCMIVKNEVHNLRRLLNSVKHCFDEIHITDTGSTDGTVDYLEDLNAKIFNNDPEVEGIPLIRIHHFEWVNDFSAARNYSFSHSGADYLFWMDGDDTLVNPEAFIQWRDKVMSSCQYWMANYNYAWMDGKPICTFQRERAIKNNHGFEWRYFLHEGCVQVDGLPVRMGSVTSWWIDHHRTEQDRKADDSRNLNIFEANKDKEWPIRMTYYYGKELFDAGKYLEASPHLMKCLKNETLEPHDRAMAYTIRS